MHAETRQEDGGSPADAKLELMEAPPTGDDGGAREEQDVDVHQKKLMKK